MLKEGGIELSQEKQSAEGHHALHFIKKDIEELEVLPCCQLNKVLPFQTR